MLEQKVILDEFSLVSNRDQLWDLYQKYLGKNWIISLEIKGLASLSLEEKKEKGKTLIDLRKVVEEAFAQKEKD